MSDGPLKEIADKHWQPDINNFETILTEEEEIKQSIAIILNTPRGSVPHRPKFGSDIYKYVDLTVNEARIGIIREVILALTIWEPRVRVIDVETNVRQGTNLCFIIRFEVILTKITDAIEVSL